MRPTKISQNGRNARFEEIYSSGLRALLSTNNLSVFQSYISCLCVNKDIYKSGYKQEIMKY